VFLWAGLACSAATASVAVAVASFAGSGTDTIQAMATDSAGNLYVAGTTSSLDFPVKAAWQAQMGDSRVMRSLDGGATWTRLASTPADIAVILPDPANPQAVVAAGDNGIYQSSDGGRTWNTVYTWTVPFDPGLTGTGLALDPGSPTHLVAMGQAGVLVSSDSGETWSPGYQFGVASCGSASTEMVAFDPFGSGTVLMGCQYGVLLSRDRGVTFTGIGPSTTGGGGKIAVFDPWHPGWYWVASSSGVQGHLYLSKDSGQTWTEQASPPVSMSSIQYLAPDPDLTNTWYAETLTGTLFVSTDQAASWTQRGADFSLNSFSPLALLSRNCPAGGALIGIGDGGLTLFLSPDFGATWQAPPFGSVTDVATGPGCAIYASRKITSDAFVAKLTTDGSQVLWATFLGGRDQDTAKALALDANENVWIAGTTSSPDFPVTRPRIGVTGISSAFVAEFSPDGTLLSSVVFGGEQEVTPVALAVDEAGAAYVVGNTDSAQFPVTPGALVTRLNNNDADGFLVKLGADGRLAYGSYLGGARNTAWPEAIAVADGQPFIGGSGTVAGQAAPANEISTGFLARIDTASSQVTYFARMGGTLDVLDGGGPGALTFDQQGNLYVAGTTADPNFPTTAGAYVSPLRSIDCSDPHEPYYQDSPGDIFVVKLRPVDWQPVYAAILGGACPSTAGNIQVDSQGQAAFSLAAGAGFPLRDAVQDRRARDCEIPQSGAVAELSADGSSLLFSTYLNMCGAPALAVSPGGNLFAGVGATANVIEIEQRPESAGAVPPRAN
jgi:hypothetical protein